MQALGPPNEGPLQGLVASRIETYGGRHRASAQSSAGSLYPRGGPVPENYKRPECHVYHALSMYTSWYREQEAVGAHSPELRDVCACAPAWQEAPLLPQTPLGRQTVMPLPTQLSLAGSGRCDSGQEQPTPNWFAVRGEPAQLTRVGDDIQSQAWPLLLHWVSVEREAAPELPLLLPQDPSRRRLQQYVPFAKGSGQARGLSPMMFRDSEPEKRHGGHMGTGPPHSPKLKVRGSLSHPHAYGPNCDGSTDDQQTPGAESTGPGGYCLPVRHGSA
ncbi:hypothetical protein P7K49_019153 [Saguinus oedipus]|uniref:Uncharacterized protein n=1 Tax=Saguinus oedipus TaxID=9490 RepID=A0ABQ9UWU3_SAGOE|nr:hypothetical protein P7K49_019153 [Saguinus oedipus]